MAVNIALILLTILSIVQTSVWAGAGFLSSGFQCDEAEIKAGPGDVVFNCTRNARDNVSVPIDPYSYPDYDLRIEYKSWFEGSPSVTMHECYTITVFDLAAAWHIIHVMVGGTLGFTVNIYIDASMIADGGQPYNKVMMKGQGSDQMPCNFKAISNGRFYALWTKDSGPHSPRSICYQSKVGNGHVKGECWSQQPWGRFAFGVPHFSMDFLDITYDYAGQYTCKTSILQAPGIEYMHTAEVLVSDFTQCSNVHIHQGEIADIKCFVTYAGNGTSVLKIMDNKGKVLKESVEKNPTDGTHATSVGLPGLTEGNHTFYCNASYLGFQCDDIGCTINVTVVPAEVTLDSAPSAEMQLAENLNVARRIAAKQKKGMKRKTGGKTEK